MKLENSLSRELHVHFASDTNFSRKILFINSNEKKPRNDRKSEKIRKVQCQIITENIEEITETILDKLTAIKVPNEKINEIKAFIAEFDQRINLSHMSSEKIIEEMQEFTKQFTEKVSSVLEDNVSMQSESFLLNIFGVRFTKLDIITSTVCCMALAAIVVTKLKMRA